MSAEADRAVAMSAHAESTGAVSSGSTGAGVENAGSTGSGAASAGAQSSGTASAGAVKSAAASAHAEEARTGPRMDDDAEAFLDSTSLYMILTYSGKPIFYSRGREEEVVRYTAVIQAIVSCFEAGQELRSFEAARTLFVVHTSHPLILVAVDKRGHSVAQLRAHLELLHAQILSVLTKQQLERHFAARPGLDLRPMLGGTDVFLNALVRAMDFAEPWSWLGALESLQLRKSVRDRANAALLDARAQSSLLYGLVLSASRFGCVVRPRQHSLHPPDLHLVFSMLFNTAVFQDGEHWVPICFPRFNPNGFLYAYIRFIARPDTVLVLVSPDRHGFYEMQTVGAEVVRRLEPALAADITAAAREGRIDPATLPVRPIEYFVYKSRAHVQFVQSQSPAEPLAAALRLRFVQLQASMARTRQRICWFKWQDGSILGWTTPAFELYCYASTDQKDTVSRAVKKLVGWIRKHEERLFIVDGATF